MKEDKWILIIILVVALLIGGLWFLNRSIESIPVDTSMLVRDDSQILGKKDALVTVVEFGDFQCPSCAALNPVIKDTLAKYSEDQVSFVYRNFPLSQHQFAVISAQAAEIAGDQGKYWEMNALIYERQNEWSLSSNPRDLFIGYAETLGLNISQFTTDLDAGKYKDKIDRDAADGISLGINSTPTIYVNGIKIMVAGGDSLVNAIDSALAS